MMRKLRGSGGFWRWEYDSMENGQWKMENGKWKMENERSEPGHLECGGVDNVKCKMDNGKWTM